MGFSTTDSKMAASVGDRGGTGTMGAVRSSGIGMGDIAEARRQHTAPWRSAPRISMLSLGSVPPNPLQLTIPPQGHRAESRRRLGGALAAERQSVGQTMRHLLPHWHASVCVGYLAAWPVLGQVVQQSSQDWEQSGPQPQ